MDSASPPREEVAGDENQSDAISFDLISVPIYVSKAMINSPVSLQTSGHLQWVENELRNLTKEYNTLSEAVYGTQHEVVVIRAILEGIQEDPWARKSSRSCQCKYHDSCREGRGRTSNRMSPAKPKGSSGQRTGKVSDPTYVPSVDITFSTDHMSFRSKKMERPKRQCVVEATKPSNYLVDLTETVQHEPEYKIPHLVKSVSDCEGVQ
ncbi:hypothetical protein PIB30_059766 [Stylosanthes scabra]|uniref:Uncharacterized protein n=1 Tax=Stylosanthes scabra TaxID=79078 RepID=A0ABU6QL33_9FABA|nr:hypothetical protein [Stylosanthes scabra]